MPELWVLSSTRIVADSSGVSRFEDYEIRLESADFAPPAPPMQASEFDEATRYGFVTAPAGWYGDWHPAPRRQVAIFLKGELEVAVAAGDVRRFGPGSTVLLEDTFGKGHTSRVVGSSDVVLVFVQLE